MLLEEEDEGDNRFTILSVCYRYNRNPALAHRLCATVRQGGGGGGGVMSSGHQRSLFSV